MKFDASYLEVFLCPVKDRRQLDRACRGWATNQRTRDICDCASLGFELGGVLFRMRSENGGN